MLNILNKDKEDIVSAEILKDIVYPYINFIIFFVLCIFILRKPIANIFVKRKEEFDKYYKEAAQLKEECEKKAQELHERETHLTEEIDSILSSSKKIAQAEADAIIDNANKLAAHIQEETLRLCESEIQKVKQGLKEEILKLVKQEVVNKIQQQHTVDKEFLSRRIELVKEKVL